MSLPMVPYGSLGGNTIGGFVVPNDDCEPVESVVCEPVDCDPAGWEPVDSVVGGCEPVGCVVVPGAALIACSRYCRHAWR